MFITSNKNARIGITKSGFKSLYCFHFIAVLDQTFRLCAIDAAWKRGMTICHTTTVNKVSIIYLSQKCVLKICKMNHPKKKKNQNIRQIVNIY